jgi:hypothetical protein
VGAGSTTSTCLYDAWRPGTLVKDGGVIITSIDPPAAENVVNGLNRLASDVAVRSAPKDYPSGDRLSSELGGVLRDIFSLEAQIAERMAVATESLEAILAAAVKSAVFADAFVDVFRPAAPEPTPISDIS